MVAVSGVAAEKTGAAQEKYNRAALGVREILSRWNAHPDLPTSDSLAAALHSSEDAIEKASALVAGDRWLERRLAHFLAESERLVPGAGEALAKGDLDALGTIVDESQEQAAVTLGNQVPETVFLAEQARAAGALAASSFGAGFGGSVWALLPTVDAEDFAEEWLGRYRAQYAQAASQASTLVTRPGSPLRPVV